MIWIIPGATPYSTRARRTAHLAALGAADPERFPDGFPLLEAIVAVAEGDAVRVWSIGGGLCQHIRGGLVIGENRPDWLMHSRDDVVIPMPFALVPHRWASPAGVSPQVVRWKVRAGDAVVVVNGVGVRRAGWYPTPTHWLGSINAAGVGAALRARYPGIRSPGEISEPPPFAGAAAVLTW